MIGRFFSPSRDEDAEARLAARVRRGTAPITHTGQGVMPTKIREHEDLEAAVAVAVAPSGSDGRSEVSFPPRADAAGDVGGSSTGTRTPARSTRRDIVFFDEVETHIPAMKAKSIEVVS